MIISQKILFILTLIGTGIIAACYSAKDMWSWVFLIIAFGGLWLYGQKRRWRWVAPCSLIFFIFAAVRGIFLDIHAGWFLLSIVIVLCAWDLDSFVTRLKGAERVEKGMHLERVHLSRLMITGALGLILGGIPITTKIELKFGWILFWGMILIVGLSRFIEMLNREGD